MISTVPVFDFSDKLIKYHSVISGVLFESQSEKTIKLLGAIYEKHSLYFIRVRLLYSYNERWVFESLDYTDYSECLNAFTNVFFSDGAPWKVKAMMSFNSIKDRGSLMLNITRVETESEDFIFSDIEKNH